MRTKSNFLSIPFEMGKIISGTGPKTLVGSQPISHNVICFFVAGEAKSNIIISNRTATQASIILLLDIASLTFLSLSIITNTTVEVSDSHGILWPSDTIWGQRSRSTLAQVMACCLTAPSHHLNQC